MAAPVSNHTTHHNALPVATPIFSPDYVVPRPLPYSYRKQWNINRKQYLCFIVHESFLINQTIHWGHIANKINKSTNAMFLAKDCKMKYYKLA